MKSRIDIDDYFDYGDDKQFTKEVIKDTALSVALGFVLGVTVVCILTMIINP